MKLSDLQPRVVRLLGPESKSTSAKREARRRWDERNRARKAQMQRERYWRQRDAANQSSSSASKMGGKPE